MNNKITDDDIDDEDFKSVFEGIFDEYTPKQKVILDRVGKEFASDFLKYCCERFEHESLKQKNNE